VIENFKSKQFLVFLVTGGIAALVNFFSRLIYNHWVGFSAAVIMAYATGMVTAFVLARTFVFPDSKQLLHRSVGFFVSVNLLGIAQTWLISMVMIEHLLPLFKITSYAPELAHAVGIVVPVFTSYLGHKHFSFK
jgi:putative flippase GtrA